MQSACSDGLFSLLVQVYDTLRIGFGTHLGRTVTSIHVVGQCFEVVIEEVRVSGLEGGAHPRHPLTKDEESTMQGPSLGLGPRPVIGGAQPGGHDPTDLGAGVLLEEVGRAGDHRGRVVP